MIDAYATIDLSRKLISFAAWILRMAATLVGAWTALALWFQFPKPLSLVLIGIALLITAFVVRMAGRGPIRAWLVFSICLVIVVSWWGSITPSQHKIWAIEDAKGVTADFSPDGDIQIHNIRNFDWFTQRNFKPDWETKTFRLDQLKAVDLVSSSWGMRAIAHTMISFEFADGRHLVFSPEVRREKSEAFSEFGGFFKQFELVLLAGEENDILRLRTNIRGETVSLFRLKLSHDQMRDLFMSYLRLGNKLSYDPEFYKPLTTNWTATIFKLVEMTSPGTALDWRVFLPGYFPDYLYDHHMLASDLPLAELKSAADITDRAQAAPAADYSESIRSP
ncbi:Lnb N-terminal periplasmic domain-containing protein [Oryzifoliimicrobium ureilyticus]|uniref:Lnb N-terminal periplasmic domain-containing protein n=1 Tax=Oryzifoliimicrobium ureilyticus TaxID=3113724 RepID=UPI0030763782